MVSILTKSRHQLGILTHNKWFPPSWNFCFPPFPSLSYPFLPFPTFPPFLLLLPTLSCTFHSPFPSLQPLPTLPSHFLPFPALSCPFLFFPTLSSPSSCPFLPYPLPLPTISCPFLSRFPPFPALSSPASHPLFSWTPSLLSPTHSVGGVSRERGYYVLRG